MVSRITVVSWWSSSRCRQKTIHGCWTWCPDASHSPGTPIPPRCWWGSLGTSYSSSLFLLPPSVVRYWFAGHPNLICCGQRSVVLCPSLMFCFVLMHHSLAEMFGHLNGPGHSLIWGPSGVWRALQLIVNKSAIQSVISWLTSHAKQY